MHKPSNDRSKMELTELETKRKELERAIKKQWKIIESKEAEMRDRIARETGLFEQTNSSALFDIPLQTDLNTIREALKPLKQYYTILVQELHEVNKAINNHKPNKPLFT